MALLTLWALVNAVGALSVYFWQPGGFGTPTNDAMRVVFVIPGSPGAKAGIVPGDLIDESPTPFAQRRLSSHMPAPGARETIRVVHGTRSRVVTLTAYKLPLRYFGIGPYDVAKVLVSSIIVVLGALLVLMRPSILTWAFFIYCVGLKNDVFGPLSWMYYIPHWLWVGFRLLGAFLDAAGWTAFLIFAILFPLNYAKGRISRTAMWLLLTLFALSLTAQVLIVITFHPSLTAPIELATALLAYAAAMAIFVANYRRARSDGRQRIRWVMIGLAIALTIHVINVAAELLMFVDIPAWFFYAAIFLPLAMPVSVVYAIARYRV
ncbi:MAG: hypothetical protein M3Z37_03085, partial [Candidatus Eremiobacteraeota bacterium]|nr:hypothetical protein [Candidatus Eremiobacteraeota bacterium]